VATTLHPLILCELRAADVPDLAVSVQEMQDEPFGGVPTLAYARVFERARAEGVIVLVDGQGMDEQWAGYDYYAQAAGEDRLVQGSQSSPVRPDVLLPEFRSLARPLAWPSPFEDRLRNMQVRDIRYTKIPRALRFNDRISMRSSTELREPFLDHRLVELALRQPADRKIADGQHKRMLRQIARTFVPRRISETPKRPLQTPQREWLRGPLREWATSQIETALHGPAGAWFDAGAVRRHWNDYLGGATDSSFYVWQWISAGLLSPRFASSSSFAAAERE
jgi:asparagine synthase (glutamine-hydrolysing)